MNVPVKEGGGGESVGSRLQVGLRGEEARAGQPGAAETPPEMKNHFQSR